MSSPSSLFYLWYCLNRWWTAPRASGPSHGSSLLILATFSEARKAWSSSMWKTRSLKSTLTRGTSSGQTRGTSSGQTPTWEKWMQTTNQDLPSTENSYVSCPEASRMRVINLYFGSLYVVEGRWRSFVLGLCAAAPRKAWWQLIPVFQTCHALMKDSSFCFVCFS